MLEAEVREVIDVMNAIAADELDLSRPIDEADELVRDLHLDSLGLVVLVVGLEDRYRIKLTHDDAEGVLTAGDLARLVRRRAAETAIHGAEGGTDDERKTGDGRGS